MSREYSKVTVTIENSKQKQTIEMFHVVGSEVDVKYEPTEANALTAFFNRVEPCIEELVFTFKPTKQEHGEVYVLITEEK